MEIKLPFLKEEIGVGDVVKAATTTVGIRPCSSCEERRRLMNAALRLVPRQPPPQEWTKPPEVPQGWRMIRSFSTPDGKLGVQLFHNQSQNSYRIWNVIGGEYRNAHTFCCTAGMEEQAIEKWRERCHSS